MKKKLRFILLMFVSSASVFSLFGFLYVTDYSNIYLASVGTVKFTSNAPLEIIKAESQSLIGGINVEKDNFTFKIPMRSFHGFNSPLQKEHFNENYTESDKYPHATFTGKIIENIDFKAEGTYPVRAKGILTVHGVAKEIIIKAIVNIKKNEMTIRSNFKVVLADYNIKIPTIIYQKIAEIIDVEINILLKPKK